MKRNCYLLIMIGLMIFSFSSCEPDKDDDNADLRDKFVGTWRFNESEAKSDLAFYTVEITKDAGNSTQVLLKNFGRIGNNTVEGIVTANRITVDKQTRGSIEVSGIGNSASNTRMNWTYTINDGANEETFTAVADKQ